MKNEIKVYNIHKNRKNLAVNFTHHQLKTMRREIGGSTLENKRVIEYYGIRPYRRTAS